jgi:hypothetical protein
MGYRIILVHFFLGLVELTAQGEKRRIGDDGYGHTPPPQRLTTSHITSLSQSNCFANHINEISQECDLLPNVIRTAPVLTTAFVGLAHDEWRK